MHSNRWRGERVIVREDESTPVLAIMIWRIGRASQYVMPPTKESVTGKRKMKGYLGELL